MFKQVDSASALPGVDWVWLERILARFEADCRDRPWPCIDDYLPKGDGADRLALLVELVHADLELRRRAGEPLGVDEYLERYPELTQDATVSGELLARDAELSCQDKRAEPRSGWAGSSCGR